MRTIELKVYLGFREPLSICFDGSTAAVLAVAVADARYVDSLGVRIRVEQNNEWIDIKDDCIGMSADALSGRNSSCVDQSKALDKLKNTSWIGFEGREI